MKVQNAAGRTIQTEINGESYKPYGGGIKYQPTSKLVDSLQKALKTCGVKDGMTLSFHHQLRNGDFVINQTLDACRELGVKNLRLAQTALFSVHEPVIEHIKEGTVTRIEGSINGPVGDYVSKNPLQHPVILRSHGGRWSAIRRDELHIDIAVIAVSQADMRGNATGMLGKSAFGKICYSQPDMMHADHVIIVTDTVVEYPCIYQEIHEGYVDCVVQVDRIGDPDKIVTGSLKITDDPMKKGIAKSCVDLMDAAGLLTNDLIFQLGAGGISLAAVPYLQQRLEEKNVVARVQTGGLTSYIVDMYKAGRMKYMYHSQCFDTGAVEFVSHNPPTFQDIGHYADASSKGRTVDMLDAAILGATEVDVDFNVNVNTHSDGRLLHGIGGHQDVAAGANLTMITCPIYRKKNPIVRDHVTTITTPGDIVDAIVTDHGIAINPKRKDLLKAIGSSIDLISIEELRDMAYAETSTPEPLELTDTLVGMTKYFDGTVLDNIYQVKS